MQSEKYSVEIGGKTITAEFTDLAEQANGSVIMRSGNTTVLVTAVMGKHPLEGRDFFPLTVDYEERFYAAGAILGSQFMRREGRPSEEAILSGRIVDRTIRPLFPQHIRHEVQVVITVLSIGEEDPDTLGVLGASLALATSNIPWRGPVGCVRLGKTKSGSFILNPSYMERQGTDYELDILACGKDEQINMIEVAGKQVGEEILVEGLEAASAFIAKQEEWQKEIISKRSKTKKEMPAAEISKEYRQLFESEIEPLLDAHIFSGPGKKKIHQLEEIWQKLVKEKISEGKSETARQIMEIAIDALLHKEAVAKSRRPDGRLMDELRPLFAKAGEVSPVLHGSGIFYRGATHVLSVLTLGGPQDALTINSMEEKDGKRRFMHHYNFPPYSSGETGRMGGTNRRMIGHGALAEKAVAQVLPAMEKFPYTIRLVSECLSSNGSTSMASVCAST
ncbi:MAG: polyribonucleotide nucleotidyltransferase, partial [Patescibacteria group bacterium]